MNDKTEADTDRPGGRRAGEGNGILVIQSMLAAILVGGLFVLPPAQGMMMLVPLAPAAAHALPALALRGDTRLVGTGPVPGSLLVYGRRAALAARLIGHGIVTMASPAGGCATGRTA